MPAAYAASAQNALGGPHHERAAPAGLVVAPIPPSTPLKIMPLGDSITYGQGAAGGYRAPLFQMLVSSNFNVMFVGSQKNNPASWLPSKDHEGHSGYRIDQITSGFSAWVNAVASPDIILLLIGTNDYGQQYATPSATNRFDRLIWHIATNRPNAKLIVANVVLRTDNSTYENQIQAGLNRSIPGIVKSHAALGHRVSFVDMHAALGASDLIDGLHPNQSGYDKMAAAWSKAIMELIPPPGSTNASVLPAGTHCTLTYCGIPQCEYITQRSTNLAPGSWLPISTNIAPAAGAIEVFDSYSDLPGAATRSAFYRLVQQ